MGSPGLLLGCLSRAAVRCYRGLGIGATVAAISVLVATPSLAQQINYDTGNPIPYNGAANQAVGDVLAYRAFKQINAQATKPANIPAKVIATVNNAALGITRAVAAAQEFNRSLSVAPSTKAANCVLSSSAATACALSILGLRLAQCSTGGVRIKLFQTSDITWGDCTSPNLVQKPQGDLVNSTRAPAPIYNGFACTYTLNYNSGPPFNIRMSNPSAIPSNSGFVCIAEGSNSASAKFIRVVKVYAYWTRTDGTYDYFSFFGAPEVANYPTFPQLVTPPNETGRWQLPNSYTMVSGTELAVGAPKDRIVYYIEPKEYNAGTPVTNYTYNVVNSSTTIYNLGDNVSISNHNDEPISDEVIAKIADEVWKRAPCVAADSALDGKPLCYDPQKPVTPEDVKGARGESGGTGWPIGLPGIMAGLAPSLNVSPQLGFNPQIGGGGLPNRPTTPDITRPPETGGGGSSNPDPSTPEPEELEDLPGTDTENLDFLKPIKDFAAGSFQKFLKPVVVLPAADCPRFSIDLIQIVTGQSGGQVNNNDEMCDYLYDVQGVLLACIHAMALWAGVRRALRA